MTEKGCSTRNADTVIPAKAGIHLMFYPPCSTSAATCPYNFRTVSAIF
jgi:hypothetical protein